MAEKTVKGAENEEASTGISFPWLSLLYLSSFVKGSLCVPMSIKLILSLCDVVSNHKWIISPIYLPESAFCTDRQILQDEPVTLAVLGVLKLKGIYSQVSDQVPGEHAIRGRRLRHTITRLDLSIALRIGR